METSAEFVLNEAFSIHASPLVLLLVKFVCRNHYFSERVAQLWNALYVYFGESSFS